MCFLKRKRCSKTNRNRSEMKIIVAILEAAKAEGQYGAPQTRIMYKAFLSYEQLKQYLPILRDNDVLRYNEETRTLKITEKGLRFLEIYKEINKITMKEEDDSSNKVNIITDSNKYKHKNTQANPREIVKASHLKNNNNNYYDKPLAKLLLVDDDSDVVGVIKQGLEKKGFQVDSYNSSREALNAFKPEVYDLAILDIRMPYFSGFDLYRELKIIDPSLTACFLSAFEIYPNEIEKMFSPSGEEIRTIIKKPVSIHDLVRETNPLLRISSIKRARRGEHFLIAFDRNEELIEQSLQFLKTGLLEKDEDILLVTDGLPKDTIRDKIAREWNVVADDIRNLEQEGRITLMTFAEWHLTIDNRFDAKRSKSMMVKMAQKALDNGRNGLRFVNDANAFISNGRKMQQIVWESSLEKQFDLPITLLCAYSEQNIIELDNFASATLRKSHNKMWSTREI